MDQNIIILVLILIAILVAFYATYLSMDNSRKIRRLQNDIRETLGNINSTLKQEPKLSEDEKPSLPKNESRTNLQDLDQFPSLEEIENYDSQKMMEPIDPELKKELDQILDDSGENISEEANEASESVESKEESTSDKSPETEVSNENPELLMEEAVGEELEPVAIEAMEENVVETITSELETVEIEAETNEELPEVDNALEKELLESEPMPDIEPISLSDANLLQEIEALCPENRLQNKADDTESVVESVIGEDEKKKRMSNLPDLDNLTEEILTKMHDKNVKLICKREGIKVRGTKVERIQRILEAKEYKINVN